jgi:hypothetical protein
MATSACEYCRLPQAFSLLPFQIDHIIAQKHGGKTVAANLALSCFYDNSFKGPNVAGLAQDREQRLKTEETRTSDFPERSPCFDDLALTACS